MRPPLEAKLQVWTGELASRVPFISFNLLTPDILNGLFTELQEAAQLTLTGLGRRKFPGRDSSLQSPLPGRPAGSR